MLKNLPRRAVNKLQNMWRISRFKRYRRRRTYIYGREFRTLRGPGVPGLVSVILPVYNGEGFLREAIDTLLDQSYPHFELIAVDDGSTDRTPAILDAYAREHAHIRVVHQANCRLPCALSQGFRSAHGQYLTWTSHDNRHKPDYLAGLVEALEQHPDWDMVYADVDIIGDSGEPLKNSEWNASLQNPPGSEHIHYPHFQHRLNAVAHNTVGAAFMYRDYVSYLLGDYYGGGVTIEDYDYWMQINDLFTLRHIPDEKSLYDYRLHAESLTAQDAHQVIPERVKRLLAFERFRWVFYLKPLAWIVEALTPTDHARQAAIKMTSLVRHKKHRLAECSDTIPGDIPTIYVGTASDSSFPPPPAETAVDALKVLLLIADDALPRQVAPGWDLCVALTGETLNLPQLKNPYQGWLATPSEEVFFAAVDIRARSDYLRRLRPDLESKE